VREKEQLLLSKELDTAAVQMKKHSKEFKDAEIEKFLFSGIVR